GVALDRADLAVRIHALHEADVLVEDDQVAGLRRVTRGSGVGAAGPLSPGVEGIDGAEALALVAERSSRLARRPGDEVGAPRAGAWVAGRGRAVLRDPRRVV